MVTALASPPLETGWLPTTPVEDNVLGQFLHSQAAVNSITATAVGGRTEHSDDVFLADTGGPIPYLNQAILGRPLESAEEAVLRAVEAFFDDAFSAGRPATLLSLWPTPDLSTKGWSLVGHPAMVLRSPGAVVREPAPGVTVRAATAPEDFATAERVAVEGYPFEEAQGLPAGSLFPPGLAGTDLIVRLGCLDGVPVAVDNVVVAHGLVNLCLGATMPAARRRGVWEALVWARVNDAPELPAVAYTSDYSRPGFLQMGFLPITRFTLWCRSGGLDAQPHA